LALAVQLLQQSAVQLLTETQEATHSSEHEQHLLVVDTAVVVFLMALVVTVAQAVQAVAQVAGLTAQHKQVVLQALAVKVSEAVTHLHQVVVVTVLVAVVQEHKEQIPLVLTQVEEQDLTPIHRGHLQHLLV